MYYYPSVSSRAATILGRKSCAELVGQTSVCSRLQPALVCGLSLYAGQASACPTWLHYSATSVISFPQNNSFAPNCRMRGLPAEVMRPNELVLETTVPGLLKFTLLKMLKNSARNWNEARSVTRVFFSIPMSLLKKRGPRTMFLPEEPNVPGAFATNFEVSNHC